MKRTIRGDYDYEPDLPDGWEPIPNLCYPFNGSKAYRRKDGANAHIINMYGTGSFFVQAEVPNRRMFYEQRHSGVGEPYDGYDKAKKDLERVVAHFEETGRFPGEDERPTVREVKLTADLTLHLPLDADVAREIDERLHSISRFVDGRSIKEAYEIEEY